MPLLVISAVTFLIGDTLLERIVTVLFIDVILVLALQVFMGNSGILSFAVAGFMGIGAYSSVLFSMTPAAKAAALPDLYPFLTQVHLPFVAVPPHRRARSRRWWRPSCAYPLMRLSDAAGVITIFSLLIIINVVLVHWSTVTNGPRTLFGVDRFTYLGTTTVFCIVFLAVAWWFKESSVGLKLRASRDDALRRRLHRHQHRGDALRRLHPERLHGGLRRRPVGAFHHLLLPYAFYLSAMFVFLAMLVIGGPNGVSGAVVGTVLVTLLREGLRSIENNVNMSKILPSGLVGFTEIVMAVLLIVILILRPSGHHGRPGAAVAARTSPGGRRRRGQAAMCDTFAALPSCHPGRRRALCKERRLRGQRGERARAHSAARVHVPGEVVRITHLVIPQARETFEVILTKAFWTWGCEIGVNEFGLCMGEEAVFTTEMNETEGRDHRARPDAHRPGARADLPRGNRGHDAACWRSTARAAAPS